jgi:hypothetical protein
MLTVRRERDGIAARRSGGVWSEGLGNRPAAFVAGTPASVGTTNGGRGSLRTRLNQRENLIPGPENTPQQACYAARRHAYDTRGRCASGRIVSSRRRRGGDFVTRRVPKETRGYSPGTAARYSRRRNCCMSTSDCLGM